jgi:N-methylhydantoinase B
MPVSQHIDEEGFRISPQKLTPELISWMCGESRTPDERRGDLQAQLAAVRVGVERLQALCVTYQPDIVSARALALQQYTARMVRAAIHTWPNGTFQFSDLLDDDGFGHTALNITCQLTIKDDSLAFDFTETGPQTQGPVNAVRAITVSAVNYVIRCLVGGDVPVNSGVMEPVEVLPQPGSLVDAAFPAAVAAGNVETSQRLVDVVFGAFAKALPELVPAASCGSMNNVTIGGVDARTGSAFAYYETIAGGAGANADCHGASARHTHMTNTLNTPVEALEHAYPFRIDSYAIRTGSGGQGLKNGGDGVERVYAFSAPATVTLLTERRINPPYGLAGGQPGQVGNSSLFGVDGKAEALPPKVSVSVGPGQKLTILTPGGGGWGCLDGVDGDDKAKR